METWRNILSSWRNMNSSWRIFISSWRNGISSWRTIRGTLSGVTWSFDTKKHNWKPLGFLMFHYILWCALGPSSENPPALLWGPPATKGGGFSRSSSVSVSHQISHQMSFEPSVLMRLPTDTVPKGRGGGELSVSQHLSDIFAWAFFASAGSDGSFLQGL